MSTSNSLAAQETTRYSLADANLARQAEWDEKSQLTLSYRGNELAGEVGEACNVIKKLDRERMGVRGSRDTAEHLAEELADVVICVDLIASAAGIDLDAAVRGKFNATSEKYGLKTRLGVRADLLRPDRDALIDSLWESLCPSIRQSEIDREYYGRAVDAILKRVAR